MSEQPSRTDYEPGVAHTETYDHGTYLNVVLSNHAVAEGYILEEDESSVLSLQYFSVPEDDNGKGYGQHIIKSITVASERLGATSMSAILISTPAVVVMQQVFGDAAHYYSRHLDADGESVNGDEISYQEALEHSELRQAEPREDDDSDHDSLAIGFSVTYQGLPTEGWPEPTIENV